MIGDECDATLLVNNAMWTITGNVRVGGGAAGHLTQSNAVMTVGGNFDVGLASEVTVGGLASLNIGGNVSVGKQGTFTYQGDREAANTTYEIKGGSTSVFCPPMGARSLVHTPGGGLTFEDTANAFDATINVEGGAGDGGSGGLVLFTDDTSAGRISFEKAEFRTKGGHAGRHSQPASTPPVMADKFVSKSASGAYDSVFINEGGAEYFGGTGAVLSSPLIPAPKPRSITTRHLRQRRRRCDALFRLLHRRHGKHYQPRRRDIHLLRNGSGRTDFYDSSDAGNATIENLGAASGSNLPGRNRIPQLLQRALSHIDNRAHLLLGRPGRPYFFFYDFATAADATIPHGTRATATLDGSSFTTIPRRPVPG